MSEGPTVIVCAGGGGVGKTTASAALALALARAGLRALVVTVDPARRLADALGVAVDTRAHAVDLEPGLDGRLLALMPEPEQASRDFVRALFEDHPEAGERLLDNRLYRVLEDRFAGMHEVVAMALVARTVEARALDVIVIDTAPSRHALDFVTYPERLGRLLDSRAVAWISRLAERMHDDEDGPRGGGGGLLGWGRRRVEGALGAALGAPMVASMAALFAELALVRERFVGWAMFASRLLLGPGTRYLLVAAPTGAATDDARYLAGALASFDHAPRCVVLNRAQDPRPAWREALERAPRLTPALSEALAQLDAERARVEAAAREASARLAQALPGVACLALPRLPALPPEAIVAALADALRPHLASLTGLVIPAAGRPASGSG